MIFNKKPQAYRLPQNLDQAETIALLTKLKIRKDAYTFACSFPNESYCLCFNRGKWEYYYSERGQRSGLRTFDTEHEACLYLLQRLSCAFPILKECLELG